MWRHFAGRNFPLEGFCERLFPAEGFELGGISLHSHFFDQVPKKGFALGAFHKLRLHFLEFFDHVRP